MARWTGVLVLGFAAAAWAGEMDLERDVPTGFKRSKLTRKPVALLFGQNASGQAC